MDVQVYQVYQVYHVYLFLSSSFEPSICRPFCFFVDSFQSWQTNFFLLWPVLIWTNQVPSPVPVSFSIWKGSNIEGYEYILDCVKYLCFRRGTYHLFRRCGGTDKAAFSVAVPMRPSHPQRSFDAKRILEEIGGCAVTTRG